MKLALVTDTHFGGRGDSLFFDRFFHRFYEKVFFPVLDELKITNAIHLGDVFDRRKFVNYLSLSNCKNYFFNQLQTRNIHLDLIVGNHDTFYKNTNSVNSPHLLLGEYDNLSIHHRAAEVQYGSLKALLIPWVCQDNMEDTADLIEGTTAQVVFGHLEVAGFEMYRGYVNDGGVDPSRYRRFDQVYSGHFHHRSTSGNITYLGNPYEMTWSDYDDPRGFHVYDTETRELTFIENPFRMFHKVFYDDTTGTDYLTMDIRFLHDKYVKVVVVNKTDYLKFDKFLDRLYNVAPAELKVVENMADYDEHAVDTEQVDVEDIGTMMEHYVDAIDTDLDKPRLKAFLKTLYVEAKALQEAEE